MNTATDSVKKRLLSVDDYQQMYTAGIIPRGSRVELIDGEIFDMPPIGLSHSSIVDRLNHSFVLATQGQAIVRVQSSIILGKYSQPEPDIALLKYRQDYYASKHAEAADVLMIVEVSESSLRHDSKVKAPLYARHGIAEYWLIDVNNREVLQHSRPESDSYASVTQADTSQPLNVRPLPGVAINLSPIFP